MPEEKSALEALAAKERRQAEWGVAEDRGYLLGMREVCHVLAVRLGIATGMRLGEVLGLTWGAVDFGRGLVSVARTLKADGTLKEPKTEAGKRVVAVDAVTMAHLRAWRALPGRDAGHAVHRRGGGFPRCCARPRAASSASRTSSGGGGRSALARASPISATTS